MNFNNTLVDLDEQVTLVFGDVTLSLSELRYAIDLATLGSLSHALMASLKTQDISIQVGAYNQQGQWCPLSNSAWFQNGVACEVLQPGAAEPQRGNLKLQISLEFHPEAIGQPAALGNSSSTAYLTSPSTSHQDFREEPTARLMEFQTNFDEANQTKSGKTSIFDPSCANLGNGAQVEAKQGSLAQR